jgi:hypothetical protein
MVPVVLLRRGSLTLSAGDKTALAGLWLPIVSPAFYHNTAPYFYVFILAPVAVACAAVLPLLARRYSMAGVSSVLVVLAGLTWAMDDHSGTLDRQRQLQRAADRLFPQRIAYFDQAGMLGRHRKMNSFMTPWGTEIYLRGDVPSMRATMERTAVPLVVDNNPMFRNALNGIPDRHLLPQDAAAGPYTVRGGDVMIDGASHPIGDVVRIDRGVHRLRTSGGHDARLVWGDRLHVPLTAPPPEPYWTGF